MPAFGANYLATLLRPFDAAFHCTPDSHTGLPRGGTFGEASDTAPREISSVVPSIPATAMPGSGIASQREETGADGSGNVKIVFAGLI
jgi:hypothetical protein